MQEIVATKIAIRKTQRYGGSYKQALIMPEVYVRDNKIETDDEMEFYRTDFKGIDALIVIPSKANGNTKKNNS